MRHSCSGECCSVWGTNKLIISIEGILKAPHILKKMLGVYIFMCVYVLMCVLSTHTQAHTYIFTNSGWKTGMITMFLLTGLPSVRIFNISGFF